MFERLCRAAVVKMTDELGSPLEASDWHSARDVVRSVLVEIIDLDDEISEAGAWAQWDGEGMKPSNRDVKTAVMSYEEIIGAILLTDKR